MKKRLILIVLAIFLFSSLVSCVAPKLASDTSDVPPVSAPPITPTPLIGFESVEPYTTGSNQEWALSVLSELDNSAEKIRLCNYLLRAHTYLMIYDKRDYAGEYNDVMNQWLNAMPDFDAETNARLQLMLNNENWTIDIEYPLEYPFKLDEEEFLQVYLYFCDANPQFFLRPIVPAYMSFDTGLSPKISIPAYYAFANRRQETYNNILNTFDNFKLQLEKSIDIDNQYGVIKYVYDHVIETVDYDFENCNDLNDRYYSREQNDGHNTILGYFDNPKRTRCKGYSAIMMYILNRLEIPTIDQGGAMVERNNNGDTTNLVLHSWNIVKLNNEWYFLDATWDDQGEYESYDHFLKERGKNNDSNFLSWHIIADDMIYPECAIDDYAIVNITS